MRKAKTVLVCLTVILILAGVGFATAQNATQNATDTNGTIEENGLNPETQTILYVAGAWLLYFILGLTAAIVKGEETFDPKKFLTSVLYALFVVIIAIGMGIKPVAVEAQYSNLVTEVVAVIMNSGAGVFMIYALNRIVLILTGLADRLKVEPAKKTT